MISLTCASSLRSPSSPRRASKRVCIVRNAEESPCRLDRLPNEALKQIAAGLLPGDGRSFDGLFAFADALKTPEEREAVFSAPQHLCFVVNSNLQSYLKLFSGIRSIELGASASTSCLGLLRYMLGLKSITPALQRIRKLVVRGIRHLTSDPAKLMQQMAERMPLLQHLELHFVAAGNTSTATHSINQPTERELAAVLQAMPRLRCLVFNGVILNSAEPLEQVISEQQVQAAGQDGNGGLEELRVEGSPGWWYQTEDMKQQQNETFARATLDLVRALGASPRYRQTLRCLDLRVCRVNEECLGAIAKGLPGLRELVVTEQPDRWRPRMTIGVEALAAMARDLKQLTTLVIAVNPAGIADVPCMARMPACFGLPDALAPLSESLTTLCIHEGYVSSEDMPRLLQALPALRKLCVRVRWSDERSENGDAHLVTWAPAIGRLEQVALRCGMTPGIASALAPHLTAALKTIYTGDGRWWETEQIQSILGAGGRQVVVLKNQDGWQMPFKQQR